MTWRIAQQRRIERLIAGRYYSNIDREPSPFWRNKGGQEMTLEASDAAAAAVQVTEFRVTLEHINSLIDDVEFYHPAAEPTMTLAIVRLANGFVVVGKSAPADPGNFDEALGEQFSLEDAKRQVWILEGYLLRQRLYEAGA